MKILKFPLEIVTTIKVSSQYEVLAVQNQRDYPVVWIAIDENNAKDVELIFIEVLTGRTVPKDAKYVDTVQFANGDYIAHYFYTTSGRW